MNFHKIISSSQDLDVYGFALRAVLVGLLIFAFGKLIPRRAAGGLSPFDFTFFWMMGGLVTSPLFDSKISFRDTLTAAFTILLTHKLIAILSLHVPLINRLFKGSPQPVILNGELNSVIMSKNLLNNELLLSELRKNDVFNISSVQAAYFENNGHLSVLTYPEHHSPTRADMKLPFKET